MGDRSAGVKDAFGNSLVWVYLYGICVVATEEKGTVLKTATTKGEDSITPESGGGFGGGRPRWNRGPMELDATSFSPSDWTRRLHDAAPGWRSPRQRCGSARAAGAFASLLRKGKCDFRGPAPMATSKWRH